MTKKQSTKKGKAEGSKERKDKATAPKATVAVEIAPDNQLAGTEEFKRDAHAYASRAYNAALAHFADNQSNPFALSRLAVVYGGQRPGDFNMVVTLPGLEREEAISDASLRKWLARVEVLCRTLEHPNCSDAFRGTFGTVFTDIVLADSGVSWTTPTVVRVMLPLALMGMVKNCNGDPDQMIAIFETLREELNDDETAEEVRAAVFGV